MVSPARSARPIRSIRSTRARPAPARRTVAVLNQKGGVGKTTVTLGLASAAAAAGRSVLVVDLDPQSSATWVLGHDGDGPDVTDVMAGRPLGSAVVASAWTMIRSAPALAKASR